MIPDQQTHQTAATGEAAPITGHDLKSWGHRPGPQFGELLARARHMQADGASLTAIERLLAPELPAPVVYIEPHAHGAVPFHLNIEASDPDEADNVAKVRETMEAVMRTPTVVAGSVMPDACPAGPVGTIPVGGVVAAKNAIHPGMHSADICCSVMISDLGDADPKAVLDAASAVTHFGPGGRDRADQMRVPMEIVEGLSANRFTNGKRAIRLMRQQFATQGDGNHFLFVGRSAATGRTAMVTHHGSRGPGALAYKEGMKVAEAYRRETSPDTLKQNAWIPADTDDGRDYWDALQWLRAWTKASHEALHDATAAKVGASIGDRFWNEHNFVFERDGLFYHGKGATPAWDGWAADATALTLIPLNMAQPVLVAKGRDASHALGFSPHGAGRNFSRSEHRRRMGAMTADQAMEAETEGLDVRFHAGPVDVSELPSSYKDADRVVAQIERFGLADIVDRIEPYGCIMAGDVYFSWRRKRKDRTSVAEPVAA